MAANDAPRISLSVAELLAMLENLPHDGRVIFSGWQRVYTLSVCEAWPDDKGNFNLTFEEIN